MSGNWKINKLQLSLERLINGCIFLAGIVVVFFGVFIIQNEKAETVLVSIGTSLIASALVAFLTSIYILKYQHAKDISEQWGIRSIKEQRAVMNIDVDEHMEKAKKHIDIIAFGLKSLRESRTNVVKDALRRNVAIRIITVNPKNEILKLKDKDEGKIEGSTEKSINELIEWVSQLNMRSSNQIELRFCETLPSEVFYRVDDYIYVGPYQYGRESQRTITTEFKSPGKGFLYYLEYFEQLWQDKEFCWLP